MTATTRGHAELSRYRLHWRVGHVVEVRWLRKVLPTLIGVLALVALITAINPAQFMHALEHAQLGLLPLVVMLTLVYYLLQGVRWHQLMRTIGARLRWQDTVLLNYAGQATALLPLGELTRAVLASEAGGVEFGAVVATVTVQELIYTMVLILFAVPGLLAVQHAFAGVVVSLVLTLAIFGSLTWCPAYRWLRLAVAHTPVLKRFLLDVDRLHNDTVLLFRSRSTLTGTWISALQAAGTISAFWLVAQALAPGQLNWRDAAFVYAISNLAGALSLIPGGVGAYEASVVGLLVGVGVHPGTAAAVALVQRVADKGLATGLGFVFYGAARKRLNISGLGTLPVRQTQPAGLRAATIA
jgi:glycosyltransferase 2 family protein